MLDSFRPNLASTLFKRPNTTLRSSAIALLLSLCSSAACADILQIFEAAAEQGQCRILHQGISQPAIALAASAYDLPEVEPAAVIRLLQRFIAQGCSIQEADSAGISPVNVPILTGQPELLKFLLDHGADPYRPISRSKSWANGKNSFALAERVYQSKKQPVGLEIIQILKNYSQQHPKPSH